MSLLSRLAVEAARGFGMLARTGAPTNVPASYLVVAGGGGSGGCVSPNTGVGGGGGAGGLLTSTVTLSLETSYTITVGAGGAGDTGTGGLNGGNSSLTGGTLPTISAIGGGGGGIFGTAPKTGGSGGGGDGTTTTAGANGTTGQGNNGGNGSGAALGYGAGGGGGAGAVGSNGTSSVGGAGGVGLQSSISGSATYYAGGGGGAGSANATGTSSGGLGGGGTGGDGNTGATDGTANTGGGGGGVGFNPYSNGKNGGSGIVIISYASATPKFVGGTITTSGGNQIHTFTSSGQLAPLTPVTADYLVVAGGGGSANDSSGYYAGGGGAGGLLTSTTTLYTNGTYIVTVGAGGAQNASGSNSVISGAGLLTVTSTGGGRGGILDTNGTSGGSGGGAGGNDASTTGGAGTAGQGYAGGNHAASSATGGGGGGGAGGVGGNAEVVTGGGTGGPGVANSISGSSVTYAAGGGGMKGFYGFATDGANGTGWVNASNLGHGGGPAVQRAGSSGTVLISYAGTPKFNGGIITSSGGNTIHTFNATGALTPLTGTVNNSLRFQSASTQYLNRTPSVVSNRKTWTWSAWVKRGTLGATESKLFGATASTTPTYIMFSDNVTDALTFAKWNGSSHDFRLTTTQVFRDPSAWYHIVVILDTTQATAANRVRIYVNGSQVTAFGTATYPSLNYDADVSNNVAHYIGLTSSNTSGSFDGYMTEINFIDGQALEPYYFGSNDVNGTWCAIPYYGMYGTNGFYLPFSNGTSTTTLGADSSGNGNNWTLNNFTRSAGVSDCWMFDVPSGNGGVSATQPSSNYCIANPLDKGTSFVTVTNSNLLSTTTVGGAPLVRGSLGVTSGKWYWEITPTSMTRASIGIANNFANPANEVGGDANSWGYLQDARKYNGGTATSYGATYANNDVIGVALDMDAGTLTFYKNGTTQGQAFSGITGTIFPACSRFGGTGTDTLAWNFGQRSFAYTPPTGFKALCTANLPAATIKQGNQQFNTVLYTGDGTNFTTLVSTGFAFGFSWIKNRSVAVSHNLYDVVRNASLESNTTGAEFGPLIVPSGTGFLPSSDSRVNQSGQAFVQWAWNAGTSTVTNTSGSISSQVRANPTAGVSVVTWTGNGSNPATIGHGLGVAPRMIITKNRVNGSSTWVTLHQSANGGAGQNGYLNLNTTAAWASDVNAWNNTAPTSSVFTVGSYSNASTNTYVAYCFSEIAGFSTFGSYTGNGSADGPFVYTGFRPKFVMIKISSGTTDDWYMYDTSRNTYNLSNSVLYADLSIVEATGVSAVIDILSNGFKLRGSGAGVNSISSYSYIYMAFAENPFAQANAR